MHSTSSLLNTLKRDFPEITFLEGRDFHWSPIHAIIYYADTNDKISLLHEVAHALLHHTEYTRDIELLKLERQAWEYTSRTLAPRYNVTIGQDHIESMLDTYRDWLHDRSLCPDCQASGIQMSKQQYQCLACTSLWRVNEARTCALRRYKIKK